MEHPSRRKRREGFAIGRGRRSLPGRKEFERPAMQDVVMLLFTAVFFVLAFLYVKACQKLR
jgi:hypothetical protein